MNAFLNMRPKLNFLVAATFLLAAGKLQAQSDIDLHDFNGTIIDAHGKIGPDGYSPSGGVTFDSTGNMYGTTGLGGANPNAGANEFLGSGMVWEITKTGRYVDLHDFGGMITNANGKIGPDGYDPFAAVTVDGAGNLYGTTGYGGPYSDSGMIWEITKTGLYVDLHDFGGMTTNANEKIGPDGYLPIGGVTFDSTGNMYGTASAGGANSSADQGQGGGMVWEITAAGRYKDVHDFGGEIANANGQNGPDGQYPQSGVSLDSAGSLYGTAQEVGAYNGGVVWEITAAGRYKDLHDFGDIGDGFGPLAGVTLDSAANMYGTTGSGGAYAQNGGGIVWEITHEGQYKELHDFGDVGDGISPNAGVTLDGAGNMYGTTYGGGAHASGYSPSGGLVWEITAGGRYADLLDFGVAKDGQGPLSGVTLDNAGNLYGTASSGGASGSVSIDSGGMVWKLVELTGVKLGEASVVGGNPATLTVSLSGSAGPEGTVVSLSSSSQSASVAAYVTIPAGESSASVTVQTAGVSSSTPVVLTATLGLKSLQATITINPAQLTGIKVAPTSVEGGNSSALAVYLNGQAGPAGTAVSLTSSSPIATVPGTIAIPKGATAANVRLSTVPVSSSATVTFTAALGSTTLHATITVNPAVLSGVRLGFSSVIGGNPTALAVYLSGAAGPGGTKVSLSSSSAMAVIASSVIVPAGETSAAVTVRTTPVSSIKPVVLTTTFGSVTVRATLTINPAALVGVKVGPVSVQGGNPSALAVYLNGATAPGGTDVTLSSSSTSVTVPATLAVPAGATAANVAVHTTAVSAITSVTLTAKLGSISLHTTLTVEPAALVSIKLEPTSVIGGNNAAFAVYLDGPAGPPGTVVALTTSSTNASLPTTVAVPAETAAANVKIATKAVSLATLVTFTAKLGSVTLHTTLRVEPAALASIRLEPTSVVGGNNAAFAVYLNGPAGPGGTVVTLSSSSAAATLPATVTVPEGATAANVQVHTSTVIVITPVTLTAKLGSASFHTTLTISQ